MPRTTSNSTTKAVTKSLVPKHLMPALVKIYEAQKADNPKTITELGYPSIYGVRLFEAGLVQRKDGVRRTSHPGRPAYILRTTTKGSNVVAPIVAQKHARAAKRKETIKRRRSEKQEAVAV